jgi:hypothetical protein
MNAVTNHRYPLNRILGDYVVGGGGALMSAGVLSLAPTVLYVDLLCGGLTGLFLVFTMLTAFRHRLRIAVDAEGVRVTGGRVRSIKWSEVEAVTLRYFSTRRNRKSGWMTLTIGAAGRRLAIESHLEGFDILARHAAEAAAVRRLTLDPATRSNFAALDINLPGPAA